MNYNGNKTKWFFYLIFIFFFFLNTGPGFIFFSWDSTEWSRFSLWFQLVTITILFKPSKTKVEICKFNSQLIHQLTWMLLAKLLAKDESLLATFVTPWRTLSFTSSKSGVWSNTSNQRKNVGGNHRKFQVPGCCKRLTKRNILWLGCYQIRNNPMMKFPSILQNATSSRVVRTTKQNIF